MRENNTSILFHLEAEKTTDIFVGVENALHYKFLRVHSESPISKNRGKVVPMAFGK